MKILDVRKIKSVKYLLKKIIPAVETIKSGGMVIFPTETVYGLGADCFNKEAVKKIFVAKKRPYTDPLIVHICEIEQIYDLARDITFNVEKLIKTFFPGPLSIVLKKKKVVPDIVTANKDTVCIRMPKNFVAKIFIKQCGVPIAAPSANIFSRVSSTHIEHILKDFSKNSGIEYIIYQGMPQYGLESTIIDCTEYPFKILRYGSITLEEIIIKTDLDIVEHKSIEDNIIKSPGMFKKHYSPTKESFLTKNLVEYLENQFKNNFDKIVVVCNSETKKMLEKKFGNFFKILSYGKNLPEIAKKLYHTLRKAESIVGINYIIIEPVKNEGLGKTIMDRLTKACEGKWV